MATTFTFNDLMAVADVATQEANANRSAAVLAPDLAAPITAALMAHFIAAPAAGAALTNAQHAARRQALLAFLLLLAHRDTSARTVWPTGRLMAAPHTVTASVASCVDVVVAHGVRLAHWHNTFADLIFEVAKRRNIRFAVGQGNGVPPQYGYMGFRGALYLSSSAAINADELRVAQWAKQVALYAGPASSTTAVPGGSNNDGNGTQLALPRPTPTNE